MNQSYTVSHPITILRNLWRVLYLIIIPVLRGFLSALGGDFAGWLSGAWLDILILLLMIGLAVLRWRRNAWACDDEALYLSSGVLFHRQSRIDWNMITTLSATASWLIRPFHAVHLRVDTLGGSYRNADFHIFVSKKQAAQLLDRFPPPTRQRETVYRPKTWSVLALSLLTSSSFAGIVFLATFISQAGRLLGNGFSDMLIDTVEDMARMLSLGIPPAAAVLAYALLAGWLAGFILTWFRYRDMTVTLRSHVLEIKGGWISRRTWKIDYPKIHYIDIRQSIVKKLLRLSSLYVAATGCGKQKEDLSCVIPPEFNSSFYTNCSILFPHLRPMDRALAPPPTGFIRYCATPLYPLLLDILGMIGLIWLFPAWRSFVLFVGMMLLIPCVCFLLVRIMDFLTSGIAFDGICYTVRYSKGFILHTVVIPAHQLAMTQITQSPFQRFGGTCDLQVFSCSEHSAPHLCRNLRMKEVQEFFHL